MRNPVLCRVIFRLIVGCSLGVLAFASATAQEFRVDRNVVESWIFQRQNGSEQARKSLVAQIDLKIESVKAFVELSDHQIQQMRLAGEGDIKRFFDEVQEVLGKVDSLEMNQNAVNEAYQWTMPLQRKLTGGIFDQNSLLQKVLRGTLKPEQLEAMEAGERRRREHTVSTLVKGYLASVDRNVPMSSDQLVRLTALLIDSTSNDSLDNEYGTYVIAYRLSKLTQQELEEILHEPQLKVLRQVFADLQGIEGFLKQQGLVHEKDDVK